MMVLPTTTCTPTELRQGSIGLFYRMMLRLKRDDGSIRFEEIWLADEIDTLKFNEHRVSLLHPYNHDCVVVTLDLDHTTPKVFRDQFFDSYGGWSTGAELKTVDELELKDRSGLLFQTKKLTRDPDGRWQFAGFPYRKNLESTVSSVPLPSIQELLRQLERARERKSLTPTPQHVPPLSAISEHDPITIQPNNDIKRWLMMTDYEDRPQFIIKLERLKGLHGIFCRPQTTVSIAAVLTGGRDIGLPSMTDLLIPPQKRVDCSWALMENSSLAMRQVQLILDSSRPTATSLPCFATDYDKTIGEISDIYELWKEYSATRLAKSLPGANDAGFLDVIEWEMVKAQK